MLFDLLHFGEGLQALHYFILCLVAILGTVQAAARRAKRRELIWFDGQLGAMLPGVLVVGSFIWFFAVDEEIFIPGLAGGELFALFAAAFLTAVPVARTIAFALDRSRVLIRARQVTREKEPIA